MIIVGRSGKKTAELSLHSARVRQDSWQANTAFCMGKPSTFIRKKEGKHSYERRVLEDVLVRILQLKITANCIIVKES
jgi:hypothetical protein